MQFCKHTSRTVTKVGDYRLEGIINKGSFSVVRLATHIPTGTKVAIKILEKAKLLHNTQLQILREVNNLNKMDHPHIIKLYQVMQTNELIYLVMEYASNGEIFDYINKHGRMNEREARSKFIQIIAGLLHCKQLNIVHRDLKAENILFDHNFDIKIADFGLSAVCKPGEKLMDCCGSLQYAAPELFEWVAYEGDRVDLWSLGITLYLMTVGKLPFIRSNIGDVAVCDSNIKFPFFLSTTCEDLIKKLLCKNPHKRISLTDLLNHQWMNTENSSLSSNLLITKSLSFPYYSHKELVDPLVLVPMKKLQFNSEDVIRSVTERKLDSIGATYRILLDKLRSTEAGSFCTEQDHKNNSTLADGRHSPTSLRGVPSSDDKHNMSTILVKKCLEMRRNSNDQFMKEKFCTPEMNLSFNKNKISKAPLSTLKPCFCSFKSNKQKLEGKHSRLIESESSSNCDRKDAKNSHKMSPRKNNEGTGNSQNGEKVKLEGVCVSL